MEKIALIYLIIGTVFLLTSVWLLHLSKMYLQKAKEEYTNASNAWDKVIERSKENSKVLQKYIDRLTKQ